MPGIYNSVPFIVGEPTTPKEVRSGECGTCGKTVYRERYTPGKGWAWLCASCEEIPVAMERRYKRGREGIDPMAYVPRSYEIPRVNDGPKQSGFDAKLERVLKERVGVGGKRD